MTRHRWLGSYPLLVGLLLAAPAPAAEESPLAQIPAKTPIVVSIHGFKRTTDRLITTIKNALPDLGPTIQTHIADFMKQGFLEGRELKGLKDDAHIFLAVTGLPKGEDEDEPSLAVVVRVTDYKTFRDSLMTEDERKDLKEEKAGYEVATIHGQELYFVNRSGYAVVSPAKKVAQKFIPKEKFKGLDSVLSKGTAEKLLETDIAVYADLAAITKNYADQIKGVKQLIDDALERAPDAGFASKEKVEMIQAISGALFQALADGRVVLLTCDFRPAGAALHMEVNVPTDSKSNGFLKTMKPSSLAGLKSLPASFTTFTAIDFGYQAYKAFHPIMKCLAAGPEDDDKGNNKAILAAMDEFLAAKPLRYLSASKTGGSTGFQVWEFTDPAKGVAAQLKLMKALKKGGEYQFVPIKETPVVKANAEKYRDAPLHFAGIKWDLEKLAEDTPGGEELVKFMKKTAGEGMNLWFGVVDQRYMQVMAPDWKTAKKLLDDYFDKKDMIGSDKHKMFIEARDNLPRDASMVCMTQAGPLAHTIGESIYAIAKGQGLPFNINPPGKLAKRIQSSYLALALTMQAGRGSFDLWLPGAAARDFRAVFEPMFKDIGD
jgi:hypothetical protein